MKNRLTLCILLITMNVFSQECPYDWYSMMREDNANYFEIVTLVDDYFQNRDPLTEEEEESYSEGERLSLENYVRWKNYWRDRVGDGTTLNAGSFLMACQSVPNYINSPMCAQANNSFWTCLGPFGTSVKLGSTYPNTPDQGIITCLEFDPDDATHNTIYAGTKFAGVWKTTNAKSVNPVWIPLQDQNGQPAVGVSSIIIRPTSMGQKKIFIATGTTGTYGVGVMASSNGGLTWSIVPNLNTNLASINKLLIEPGANPNYLYVLAERDLYKVEIATNIVTLLYHYNSTLCSWWTSMIDMCFDPSNPSIIYVSTNGFSNGVNCSSSTTGAQIFKIDATGVLLPIDVTPTSNITNIRLSNCPLPSGNNNIYASYTLAGNQYVVQIYNGTVWNTPNTYTMTGYHPFPDGFIVSPVDPYVLYSTGMVFYKLTNYSQGWVSNSTYNGDNIHADIRSILFESGTSGNGGATDKIWVGTDGGISSSITGGGTASNNWTNRNGQTLVNTEIYGIDVSENNKGLVTGGAQDNNEFTLNNGIWNRGGEGDGFHPLIFDLNTAPWNYIYETASSGSGSPGYTTDNSIYFSSDQGKTFSSVNDPSQVSMEDRPFKQFENDLYIGHTDIWKSPPGSSLSWSQLTQLSTDPNVRGPMRRFSLAKNPSNSSKVMGYAVFSNSNWSPVPTPITGFIYRNTNDITDYSSWEDISNRVNLSGVSVFLGTGLTITDIAVKPDDFNTIWVTLNGFSQIRVLKSINGGDDWVDYSDGLEPWPINCIIYQNGSDDALYIGTDRGVFYRNKNMTQWECFDKQLPVCVVRDLKINYCYQKLRAATYGRGIWESDLAESPKILTIGSTNWTSDTKITNNIVVPLGATLNISGNVNIGRGRRITVQSGGILNITSNSHLYNGCQEMWDGVYGESGSIIKVVNSTIEHAYQAFNLRDQCIYTFEGNIFESNYISIKLGDNIMRHSIIGSMIGNQFHSNANLPPYFGTTIPGLTPNTKSLCGIYIYNVDLSLFGKAGAMPNLFKNMESGIVAYNSNLTITNTSFENIHNHGHYTINYGGCGIYSQSGGNYYFKFIGGAFNGSDFSDCNEGIKIDNQDFYVIDCTMDKMNTGIVVKNSQGISGYLIDNILKCNDRGILLDKNDFAKFILAIRNDIEIGKDLTKTRAGTFGIGILEGGTGFNPPHINLISNNIKIFYGLKGIYALSSDHLVINANSISLFQNNNNPDLPNETINGIEINACNGGSIYRNTIEGSDYSDASTQHGIESNINIGTQNYFSCNNITNTLRSMNFGGGLMTCTLLGNDLGNAYEGLHITSSCAIGSQWHGGNCFSGTYGNPDGAAINMNTDPTLLAWSAIYVNDAIPSCYLPTSNHAFGDWFMPDQSEEEYSCSIPECNPCDIEALRAIDHSIASNQYGSMLYNDQVNWEGKKYLMEKLSKYPDLLIGNPVLQSFFDNYENTNVDKINHIGFGILNFNQMTSLQAIQFYRNDSVIIIMRDSLKTLYLNLINSVLESEQLILKSQINSVNAQMRLLELENKTILTAFNSSKDQVSDQVRIENSAINTNLNIEQNIKAVNDIYLQTIAKGIDLYSESMKTILYNIAVMCPYEGGPAVYLARSMYFSVQPDLVYNDKYNCAQLGYLRRGPIEQEISESINSFVVPNPSRSNARLSYNLPEKTEGICKIYNSTGQIVQQLVLSSTAVSAEINIDNFRNSIYHYIIYINEKVVSKGSFSVSR